jgi:hypothetical protein
MTAGRLRAAFAPRVVLRAVGSKARARGIHAGAKRLITLSLAGGLILGVSSARADHIPGAFYTGTHSGGGTVEFSVSADGRSITGFTITYPPGTCRFPKAFASPTPISGHSFSGGLNALSWTGSFTGVQTASGTFTVVPNYPDCLGTVSWTARTTASPPDTTPPDTAVAEGPSGPTRSKTPTFTFTSTEPGGTFECRTDDGAFAACSSPFKTAPLADGPHAFEVMATDQAANTDPTPALRSFRVDATAPQTIITAGPAGKTTNRTPRFAFRSSEAGSTFRCNLDGKPWVSCRSPKQYGRLPVGRHTLAVQASDPVGNRDPSPARRTFRVVVS